MTGTPDHIILCLSQPSLSSRDEARMLAAVHRAARSVWSPPVTVVRLEGTGPGLACALRAARDGGARHVRVVPTGFPMAANIRAWLPGAVAHFATTEGAAVRIELAEPPEPEDAAEVLVALSPTARTQDARDLTASLGKPGWQFLPDFDIHLLVCTGPRCAFRGAGPLLARLKARLAAAGLSDRCLTTSTGCLYPCNQGPLVALYPQGAWYRIPDEAALDRLVTEVIGRGSDLPDLRLAERPGSRRATISPKSARRPA
ncbi:(2Fe-2S) ferredoxin domain-containing protein [Rhodobacter calidifons]|uniref:(2Fe-2S) ferredoxin domain-containing protein n=1 Tax=Rhodobacter calidifons TaxID=2715277 RepID=A0ABX0GCC5_9RHOB|nr:(2Fe-2S) ferredoxin domain-containing protein [Rhodobacter calidifons]NHB78463.1 (2Fe-2S) ferredoxin domain-containing protein [Rhodobacter calidifons]